MQWYYAENGKQQGPVEFEQLVALAQSGSLKPDDLVWNAAMGNQWAKAASVAGLFGQLPPGIPAATEAGAGWDPAATFTSATANRDLMAQARSALDGNWGKAIGGFLIFTLIMCVLAIIPVAGGLISFVISGPMMVGWALFWLNLARNNGAEIGQLFDGFKLFANAFVTYLLIMLLMIAWSMPVFVVGIVVAVIVAKSAMAQGAAALVTMWYLLPLVLVAAIPAVIAQYRYSQAYYILSDVPGIGPMDAIRRSTQLMKGNKWKLFCLQCRFIGWGFLCILTFGIGFLWLTPYMMVSTASFYDDVKKGLR